MPYYRAHADELGDIVAAAERRGEHVSLVVPDDLRHSYHVFTRPPATPPLNVRASELIGGER